jgi:uncharacterized protein
MTATNFKILGRQITFNPEIVAPPSIDERLFPRPCSLALDISGSCNLKCVYCAENSTMPKREPMNMKTLNLSVDSIFNWSENRNGVSIHLGSGEPLLNTSLVRALDRRARTLASERHQPLSLYLTTNGTLLNNQIIKLLIAGNWNVKISIDGDQVTHDSQRISKTGEGTFLAIQPGLSQLAKQMPESFSTTSVLCHGTDPKNVFYAIASMGVRSIEIVPIAVTKTSKFALRQNDFDAYRTFIFDYAQRIAKGEKLPVNIRFHKRLLKALGYGNSRVPCGAGRTFYAVGPQGNIYPCFRFIGLSKYRLGDLSGISSERVKWFTASSGRPYDQRIECQRCWAASLCGGPCYACADLFGSGSALPSYCEIVRIESEAALWLASCLREKNVERLVELMGIKVQEE